jgi:Haloacid dehalogenase-like hydrolase
MMAGVKEMIVALAGHFPMCTISTGAVPRIERFLQHCEVRQHFVTVVGAQSTRRMKPHPEPLRYAAAAMAYRRRNAETRPSTCTRVHQRMLRQLACCAASVPSLSCETRALRLSCALHLTCWRYCARRTTR